MLLPPDRLVVPREELNEDGRGKARLKQEEVALQGASPHGSRWWMLKCLLGSRRAENGLRSKSA